MERWPKASIIGAAGCGSRCPRDSPSRITRAKRIREARAGLQECRCLPVSVSSQGAPSAKGRECAHEAR